MARLIASFFGSGLILRRLRGSDGGSGTLAGLAAFAIALAAQNRWGWVATAVGAAALLGLGLWSSSRLVGENGDAGWIVIDEAAGAFLAVIAVTSLPAAIVAFIVFRIADIVKGAFPGVAAAERLPGPVGIMADDVVAGLYGLAAGHLIQAL